jgi:alkanesulfonate monooxygenase SsuD/methylene tetrahydromethanopterin reductase-like flavin-dependent oxidoreductase (luciferase family)
MRQGQPGKLPSPDEARAHVWTEWESDQLRRYRRAQVLGTPAEVRDGLRALVDETGADELMVMTSVHDHQARRHSYSLMADVMGRVDAAQPA